MKPLDHTTSRRRALPFCTRRGAVVPLVGVFLTIFVVMAAFSLDTAYLQLVQTQLQAGTDSACKAGASALIQGKSDAQAIQAAIAMAAQNVVAGHTLKLTAADVAVGQSQLQPDGSWLFVAGVQPSQAMQITAKLTNANGNGSVGLFFAPVIGTSSVDLTCTSVASAVATEVCLVLDRSHSMCFDQTGVDGSYPTPIYYNWILGIKSDPKSGSRWESLDAAMSSFCDILDDSNAAPRVAVVTWATDIGILSTEFLLTLQTSPAVTTDLALSTDMDDVYDAIHSRSSKVMLGGTNISTGIDRGTSVLTAANVKPYAKKVMILMTDGQWNEGRDPLQAVADAVAQNITIHCICFLQNADQTTTQQIAALTGGKFYYATNSAALTAAFEDLAHSLPVVLTK